MGELQRIGMNPGSLRERYGSWFEFVAAEGDLTAAEAEALPALRNSLRSMETTKMTKSFKMVTLAVLAGSGDPFNGLAAEELALRSHAWLRRRPDLWRDVPPDQQGELTSASERSRWLAYWRRNPIEALTKGDKPPLCREEHGHLKLNCSPTSLETTCAMLLEIADWRLATYLDRAAPTASDHGFRCKLIQANGYPIAKLPDRRRNSIPEGETEARLPDGSMWVFRFAKEFINVAHPVGESGNKFGDLMREWFGPHAGQPGTAFEIGFSAGNHGWLIQPVEAATRREW